MFLKPTQSIFEATPNNLLKRTHQSVTRFANTKAMSLPAAVRSWPKAPSCTAQRDFRYVPIGAICHIL